jgi:RHS repeat-associated protein
MVIATNTATTNYLGMLDGKFAVDPDGGASYSISLKLPPGTAGMLPKLSLGYNSGGGNGLLGVGWNLQGLSAITRSPQTPAQDDGVRGAITYGNSDRYSLDGERLMVVNNVDYNDPTAIYHTERESWQKVVPIYNGDRPAGRNGPDGFLVYHKDGKVLEYGNTSDSQISASSSNPTIRQWCVNKVTDRNGNYFTITYTDDVANNTNYPQRVDYTGNAKTGLTPQRSVQFIYEDRPDHFPRYLGGYPVTTTRRLKQIQTMLDGNLIRTYTLAYSQGVATGRSQLTSIIEADAQGVTLSPTIFEWQDGVPEVFSASQSLQMVSPSSSAIAIPFGGQMLPMDFNGDGLIDLVYVTRNAESCINLTLLQTDGSQNLQVYTTSTNIPYGSQLLPLDVNGDGCIDLVCASNVASNLGLTVLLATGTNGSWTFEQQGNLYSAGPTGFPHGGSLVPMDVDGDGLMDLVYATSYLSSNTDLLKLQVLFSNGSGQFGIGNSDLLTYETNQVWAAHAQFFPMDVTGNQMTDLIYGYEAFNNNQQSAAFTLFLSQGRNGDGFIQSVSQVTEAPYGASLVGIDANGDGLGDILLAYQVSGRLHLQLYLSNGMNASGEVSFTALATQNYPELNLGGVPAIAPTNAIGSGLTDLVLTWNQNSQIATAVLQATGMGFNVLQNVTQPSEIPWGASFLPLDLSGNGKTSLVFAANTASNLTLSAMPTAGHFPDLMTTITNGLGGTHSITYAPLTDASIYTKNPPTSAANQFEVCNLLSTAVSGATFPLAATGSNPNPGTTGTTYGVKLVDFPKYVVSSYSKGDGRSATYAFKHRYAAARMDTTGRGWLGFQTVTVIDEEMQKQTQTQYNQQFPETHSPHTVTVSRLSDGALMRQDTYTYQSQTNAPNTGANIHLVQPTQLQVDYYTFASPTNPPPLPDCTEIKTIGYDEFGNENLLAETGSAVGQPLYTHHIYQNDADNWRLGFVLEEKKCADSEGNQVLTWAKTVYNPDTNTLDQWQHQLWNDQTKQWQTTTYTYDNYGNCLTATDCSGGVVTFTYDNTYYTFKHTQTGTNAAGKTLTTTTTYYPEFGGLNTKTDPNNVTWTQLVDRLGRVFQTQGPNPDPTGGTVTLAEVTWATEVNQATGKIVTYRKTVTPSGWKQEYIDGLKRVYRTIALGADGLSTVIVDKTFNGQSKILTQSLPYYAGKSLLHYESNSPLVITNTYDNYGRLVQVVKPYSNKMLTTTMVFDKVNQMTQTEAVGETETRVTQTVYSNFNGKRHPVTQTQILDDGKMATTTYAYDSLGRLLNVTDPIGVVNGASYDSLNRKISSWQEINGVKQFVHSYQHDDANRKLIHTDPKGTITTQTYDSLGRLIERDMQPAASSSMQPKTTTYTLDDPTHAYSQGKVSSVTLSDGETYLFEYDPCGNQSKTTIQIDGESYLFEKLYNVMGQVQTLTFPDGSVQTNSYNAATHRDGVSLEDAAKSLQAVAKYPDFNAFGMPIHTNFGTETVMQMTHDFDDTGMLSAQSLTGATGKAIASTSFTWNDFHQLHTIEDEVNPDNSQTYEYDSVGRLQDASGDYGAQDYQYDNGGNLTLKDGITYQSDGHQVKTGTQQNGETVETVFSADYDDNGNMTSATRNGTTTTYTYDADNYLVQSGDITLTYDYTGRRLKKQIQGGVTTYYLAPYYQVNVFPDGAKQHTIFVTGNHGVLAAVTGVDAGTPVPTKGVPAPGVFYLYQDHLKNSIHQIDTQGNIKTSIRYRPFGEIHSLEGDDTVQQKFTGKEWDDSLQLYYFGARYYDPVLGRFITQDTQLGAPMGQHDALHRYCYTTNDPTNLIDPDGHSPWWEWLVHAIVDVALIVAGVALMALTPFGGPASTLAGSTLLGAGLGGAVYDITQAATHKDLSWKGWGIQIGIGAAGGLISGGFAAGAGALVDAGAAAAEAAGNAVSAARWAVGGAARIAVNVGLGGVAGNAVSGTVGTVLSNVATHQSLNAGLGFAALLGGVLGGLGGAVGEGVASSLAESVDTALGTARKTLLDSVSKRLEQADGLDPFDKIHLQIDKIYTAESLAEPLGNKAWVLADTAANNFRVNYPGTVATFIDDFWSFLPEPSW